MKFSLRDVVSSPFRDLNQFPLVQQKVDKLVNSIRKTGWWENILGRPLNTKLQLAHGHHRLAALRMVLGEEGEAEFIVKELSDDTMLKMMAAENDEDWGGDLRSVIETVRVAVLTLAEGRIVVPVNPKTNKEHLRYAPSFTTIKPSCADSAQHPYTADALADYLTYVKKRGPDKWMADDKVQAAINVLELMELGLYKKDQLNNGRYQSDRGVVKVDYVLKETRDIRERASKTLVKAARETAKATEQVQIAQAQLEQQRRARVLKQTEYDADVARMADLTKEANAEQAARLVKEGRERTKKEAANRKEYQERQAAFEKDLAEKKRKQTTLEKQEKAARKAAVVYVAKKDSENNEDYNPKLTSALSWLRAAPPESLRTTIQEQSHLKPGQVTNLKEALDEAIKALQTLRSNLK